jgi:hypothetical protein
VGGGAPTVHVGTAISGQSGTAISGQSTETQSLGVRAIGRTLPVTGSTAVVPALTGVALIVVGVLATRVQRRRRVTPLRIRARRS